MTGINKQIGEFYRLGEHLGEGGMGVVYTGTDLRLQQPVAIKHLKPDVTNAEMIERFKREGEALAELNHPNIVKMRQALEYDGQHYLVMDFVSGGDLRALIHEQSKLDVQQVLNIAIDLADALTRAHRLDIIHRDLKPANVLIADDGTVRLTDFGVAQLGYKERVTTTEGIVGTLDYISPEVLNGEQFDKRADIWAFGVLLMEMLTGKRPFEGTSVAALVTSIINDPVPDLEELAPDAPIALLDLIYRMLDKDRDNRMRSVRAVGLELEDILHERTDISSSELRFMFETDEITVFTVKNNLPAQTTPFVGREAELSELSRLLDDPTIRLVTVLAPGGMGKTRLAIEAAERRLETFPDGVFFVDLASLDDAHGIPMATAEALGFPLGQAGDAINMLGDYLSDKQLLLVMDNWEHLIDGASFVTQILKAAPQVQVLATSRARLAQQGESLFHLSGMDFPNWETPEDALEYAAIKLFMNSATRVLPSFELTPDKLDYVARICRLVQGMPLGITLAAAWVSMLTPQEIADELQRDMDILADELGELPERQQSIRVVMQYAWDSMTEAEQNVFMKLALFRGGFTREAAQVITGANLRILMSLVNKSLIRRETDSGRYQIHELLRQFAEEQVNNSPEADTIKGKFADYYANLLKDLTPDMIGGSRMDETHARIHTEIANIKQAWHWAVDRMQLEVIDLLLDKLILFWFDVAENDHDSEALFKYGVTHFVPQDSTYNQLVLLKTKIAVAIAEAYRGKLKDNEANARDYLQRSIEYGDEECEYLARYLLVQILAGIGKVNESFQINQVLIEMPAIQQDRFRLAQIYDTYSHIYSQMGDIDGMLKYTQDALAIYQELESHNKIAQQQNNLAAVWNALGLYDKAEAITRSILANVRRLNILHGIAWQTYWASFHSFRRADFEAARAEIAEGLPLAEELKYRQALSSHHAMLALLAEAEDDFEAAQKHALINKENADKFFVYKGRQLAQIYLTFTYFMQHPTADNCAELRQQLPILLTDYQLYRRMYGVVTSAFIEHDAGNHARATELLACVLEYHLCIDVFKVRHKPISKLRENLKNQLGQPAFDEAWQRGAERDFDTVVNQLLEEISSASA